MIGGERGIRTLDTFPYTHFPGVRLQPLGHLSNDGRIYEACKKINLREWVNFDCRCSIVIYG